MPAPKTPDSKKRLVYMGLGGLALIGVLFVLTGGNDTPASKTVAVKSSKKLKSAGDTQYTDYDTKVKFEPLRTASRDVFQPLIAKPVLAVDLTNPGNISAALAEGEGWAYTGMGEIDGRPVGIIENSKTGESDMLSLGQRWKRAKVRSISDYQLVLIDEKGKDVSVKMSAPDATPKTAALGTLPPVTIPPAAITGPIGAVDVTQTVDTSQQGGGGSGGGRRGRRGNGGNGVNNGG